MTFSHLSMVVLESHSSKMSYLSEGKTVQYNSYRLLRLRISCRLKNFVAIGSNDNLKVKGQANKTSEIKHPIQTAIICFGSEH